MDLKIENKEITYKAIHISKKDFETNREKVLEYIKSELNDQLNYLKFRNRDSMYIPELGLQNYTELESIENEFPDFCTNSRIAECWVRYRELNKYTFTETGWFTYRSKSYFEKPENEDLIIVIGYNQVKLFSPKTYEKFTKDTINWMYI